MREESLLPPAPDSTRSALENYYWRNPTRSPPISWVRQQALLDDEIDELRATCSEREAELRIAEEHEYIGERYASYEQLIYEEAAEANAAVGGGGGLGAGAGLGGGGRFVGKPLAGPPLARIGQSSRDPHAVRPRGLCDQDVGGAHHRLLARGTPEDDEVPGTPWSSMRRGRIGSLGLPLFGQLSPGRTLASASPGDDRVAVLAVQSLGVFFSDFIFPPRAFKNTDRKS